MGIHTSWKYRWEFVYANTEYYGTVIVKNSSGIFGERGGYSEASQTASEWAVCNCFAEVRKDFDDITKSEIESGIKVTPIADDYLT